MSLMITPHYVSLMARYNAWQNKAVETAARDLSEAALTADKGAFFGSILSTLNHVLWADHLLMSRIDGWAKPATGISESVSYCATFTEWQAARARTDVGLLDWAKAVTEDDLIGDVTWFSGVKGRNKTQPIASYVVHLFNHQTHHRGQVHAMLTAAGAKTEDSDLVFMPD